MSLAEKVKQIISEKNLIGFSLYSGYGLNDVMDQVRFPVGVQLNELRNDNGRCTYATYQYADDSILAYRYIANRETYTLTVI